MLKDMFWIRFGYGGYLWDLLSIQGAIPVPCRRGTSYFAVEAENEYKTWLAAPEVSDEERLVASLPSTWLIFSPL